MTTENVHEPLDLLLLVLRRWRTFFVFALLGAGCGVTYALLATRWYVARITVIPSQHSPESVGPSIAAAIPLGRETLAIDVQRIKAVFTSTSVEDAVIAKFELDARYGTKDRERTRDVLGQRCTVSIEQEAGLVALTCEDISPELAAGMAEFFGEEGNRVFGRISVSSAREERKFLEAQVEKTRRDVDEASRKLREFQRANKIIDLLEQSKAVISAMAAIKGEMLSKQLELSYVAGFSADSESNVVQLRHQIGGLAAKLRQLEIAAPRGKGTSPAATATAAPVPSDFFPLAMTVPDLRFQLDELVREQKIQETLFFVMTQRYETAKVDEARDTSTFQILDHPTVPTGPAWPSRTKSVALAGLGGLAVAFAWVVVPVWWRRRTRHAAFA